MHVTSRWVMLQRECDHDIRILSTNRGRIAVGKIDTAVGQANVVDDAAQLLRRHLLADFVFHSVTQSSGFFNTRSGWGAHVQREFAGIHRGEKVLSQPRVQSEGEQAGQQKAAGKNSPMVNKRLQQPPICTTNILKSMFEPALE